MSPLVMPRTESTMTASMPSATWYCEESDTCCRE
jgi:hypothetical protein